MLEHYGHPSHCLRAPGRINLIGEHVDYTGGFTMPVAINLGLYFAIRANQKHTCRIMAANFEKQTELLCEKLPETGKGWEDYPIGALHVWKKAGLPLHGFDLVFGGDLPNGGGLSSSAAITCGILASLDALFETGLEREQIAKMAQMVEHQYIGVKCGLMDQTAILMSREGHWLSFDAGTEKCRSVPIPTPPPFFTLWDTKVKHSLSSSAYNTRVRECADALKLILSRYPEYSTFPTIPKSKLSDFQQFLPKNLYQRVCHILTENARAKHVFRLMQSADPNAWKNIGQILNKGHASLREDYEVSCAELDYLQSRMIQMPNCLGARMVGGGFGGSVLGLWDALPSDDQIAKVEQGYFAEFGKLPFLRIVNPSGGISLIPCA